MTEIEQDAHIGLFHLSREDDVTGISGVGVVALGTVFPSGRTVISWLGDYPSTVIWDDLSEAYHVHSHDGATKFIEGWPESAVESATSD